jgi:hypothetical protein
MITDREFLLIKRKARRRALEAALRGGPVELFSYALGRACYRAELDLVVFGYAEIDTDKAINRIRSVHSRLCKVKSRMGL